jgi:hypothetical protein
MQSDNGPAGPQVPRYTTSYTTEGGCERLIVTVHLPGAASLEQVALSVTERSLDLVYGSTHHLTVALADEVGSEPVSTTLEGGVLRMALPVQPAAHDTFNTAQPDLAAAPQPAQTARPTRGGRGRAKARRARVGARASVASAQQQMQQHSDALDARHAKIEELGAGLQVRASPTQVLKCTCSQTCYQDLSCQLHWMIPQPGEKQCTQQGSALRRRG